MGFAEASYEYAPAAGDFSGRTKWRSRIYSRNSNLESLSSLRCELLRQFNKPTFNSSVVCLGHGNHH
jgi:hypothetical protein